MNPMLQKLIDQDFMSVAQADYLQQAISQKHNIIISGHRGHGILPLLASLGSVAQGVGKVKPLRNIDTDLRDPSADYYLIGDLKDTDYPSLLTDILTHEEASLITLKDADHSFSIMKLLTDIYKANNKAGKTYQLVECTKDANELKKIAKIVQVYQNADGKLERSTL